MQIHQTTERRMNKIVRHLILFCLIFALSSCGRHSYPQQTYYDDEIAMAAPIQKKPLTIVIDPGHGGKDQGAHKKNPNYEEKTLTLSTAKLLARYLSEMGYNTVITRHDDTFIALDERSDFANKLGADLFVSVHYNAASSKEAQGIEVFYYKEDTDKERVNASKALAGSVLGRIVKETQAKSRGVKHGNLAVVRETKMPAILIEGGFLTNQEDLEKIQNSKYRSMLARSIAMGVRDYIKQNL